MTLSKNWNNTSYSIPEVGEFNWQALTSFLADLADFAQATTFQKIAIRVATTSPITVSGANDCIVVSNLGVAGPVAVTLPAGSTKQLFFIVDGKGDAATNNITVTPAAGNINGAASYVINVNKAAIGFIYDGTQWTVFAEFGNTTSGTGSIPRNKLAAGTADHVVINDGSGLLSSEAQLATTRGGTGVSNAGSLTYGANNITITTSGVTAVTFPTSGTLATLAGTESLSNKTLVTPLINGGSIDVDAAGALSVGASVGANNLNIGGATSTVIIPGNLTVSGTTVNVNTTNLNVSDKNIVVNNGGNDASSEGAGITVDRTGTDGSLIYKDASATKFAAGALGSEVDLVDISTAQTLTNKSISGSTNTLTNIPASALTGTVPVANGGTNSSTALNNNRVMQSSGGAIVEAAAITANRALASDANGIPVHTAVTDTELGYVSGVTSAIQTQLGNKQASDATLTALAAYNTNGIVTQTAADTFAGRTITGTANRVAVTNGDGVSGNPTLDIGTDVVTLAGTQALTNKDYDGGTASNTSRLTLPKETTANLNSLTRKQATLVYDTTTNQVKYDNGTSLLAVGSGTGSGEINAILNPSVADTTTGWTNGTSHTLTRVTSGSPLDPVIGTALSIAATTTAVESATSGEYYSIASLASGLRNRKLKVEFYFTTEASQTWAVSVWAGATRMALSTDASGASLLPAGTTGKYTTYVDTDSSAAYTVNFTRTAGSGTATLLMTNVIFGPDIQPQGAIVETDKAITLTPVSFGTVASTSYRSTRMGQWAKIEGRFTTGTADTNPGYVSLPSGMTIDASVLTATAVLGVHFFTTGGSSVTFTDGRGGVCFYDGSDTAKVWFTDASSGATWQKKNANAIYPSGQVVDFELMVPIAEWAGSGTVNLAQNDVEYASNSSSTDADDTTSFVYGPAGSTGIFGTTALTSGRIKRVRFTSPIQITDKLTIEIQEATGKNWVPLEMSAPTAGLMPQFYQAGVDYGMGISGNLTNATDVNIYFGRYAANTAAAYGAAGSSWATQIASTAKWRVRKETAGSAVGFGLVSSTASGLMPAQTPQTALTVTGTNWTTIRAVGMAYSDVNGQWRFRFNIRGSLSVAALDITLTVSGVTAKNGGANSEQAITAAQLDSGAIATHYGFWNVNSSSLRMRFSANVTIPTVSGDIELESKPTWA